MRNAKTSSSRGARGLLSPQMVFDGSLARMIEVTLCGSFLSWTLHREGPAAAKLREDLDATLRPYLTEK